MIRLAALCLLAAALCAPAASAPMDVWLTPARAEQLKQITSRPYISAREPLGHDQAILHWRNGAREWVTTNRVRQVLGKPARNAWQDKLDASKAEKRALLDDLQSIRSAPTKKAVDALLDKHSKK